MSGPTGFLLAAGLLLLAVLAILLRPLLRKDAATSAVDRRQANLDILRDELRELERSRAEGSLNESDFEQARRELQRRLLEEVEPADRPARVAAPAAGGKRTALALLIAVPLAAAAGYAALGTPQGLDPAHTQARMSPQEIDALLQRLVDRLKANPDDMQGWVILARSYKALGRSAESAEAFGRAEAALDGDAVLLAEYAEALAEARGKFAGKPDELIARALKANPDEAMALFVAGQSANERRDYAAVVDYWGRLLLKVEPDSQDARTLGAAVDQAKELLAAQGGKPAAKTLPQAAAKTISGEVILSGKLAAQVQPNDPVFIFARPADGSSRMPLAVLRVTVADLPFRFRLDDSTAMQGGQKLSEAAAVALEARIARAGMATRSSGDLFGVAEKTPVGSQNVRLVIDQVQP
ncbi:c-type cytochrome biogenesis protein CcmI [Propionivibrio sp.]|uniref:c-type cytochrome biogenesis protein CcmI n=1 Tax=Propionivibrio sp. TaxID=2212460 RepID=UPI0039E2C470